MYFMMGKLCVSVVLWNQKRKCGKWRKKAKVSRLLLPITPNESRLPEDRNAGAGHKNLILEILITQDLPIHHADAQRPLPKVQTIPSNQSTQPTMALKNSDQTPSMAGTFSPSPAFSNLIKIRSALTYLLVHGPSRWKPSSRRSHVR